MNLELTSLTEDEARGIFYKFISLPVQGVCRVLKRIGGQWVDWPQLPAHALDGDKFICMDNLPLGKPCLMYSFGIANDWAFEDFMDYWGCEIHAYDPTVDFPAKRGDQISFYKLGLGTVTEPTVPSDTLANIFQMNGHSNATVDYLKIDIEGHELPGFPNWLETNALDNVNQLALELHLNIMTDVKNHIWLLD